MAVRGVTAVLLMVTALTVFLPGAASARAAGAAGPPAATAPASAASPAPSGGSVRGHGAGQWPLASLDAAALWRRARGAGVRIAVVDTGIDSSAPDLKNVAIESRDLLGGHPAAVSASSHGTSVAELIAGNGLAGPAGLAPAASLVDVRVAPRLPALTASAIAAGITAAVKADARVINVSAGVPRDTPALLAAVRAAEADGRLIVAGTGGSAAELYPAAIAGVLSAGAEDQHGTRAAAPAGTRLFAPGTGVFPNDHSPGVSELNGSDFAAAYVSAAAALLLSASPSLTPSAAGADLTAAAGASRLLDPDRALQLALAPRSAPKPSVTPTRQRSHAPRPPAGTPVLTYVLVALIATAVLFAAYLVFLWRRTSRNGASGSGPGAAAAAPSRPGDDRAGDGKVLEAPRHEPFSWDESW